VTTFKYPLNLRILDEFFKLDSFNISVDTLTDDPVEVLIPSLLVDKQDVDKHLAIEQEAKFDLEKLVNQTLISQDSYKSVAHYLLDRLSSKDDDDLSLNFSSSSWFNWFNIIIIIITALSFILAIISIQRVRLLTLLLANSRLPQTAAQLTRRPIPNIFRYGTTTTPVVAVNNSEIETATLQTIRNYLPLEITIIIIASLFLIWMTYVYCKHYRIHKPQTTLQIVATNSRGFSDYVVLKWFTLPHAAFTYDVTSAPPNDLIVHPVKWPFLRVTVEANFHGVSITHLQSQTIVNFPTKLFVNHYIAYKLRRILSGTHYVMIMALNKHEDEIMSTYLSHNIIVHPPEMNPMPHEAPIQLQPIVTADAPLYPVLS